MHDGELTQRIIGCAMEVHRLLGPGLLESVYEEALCHEFQLQGVPFKRQQRVPVRYKGVVLPAELRLDLIVDGRVIVDLKAKQTSRQPTSRSCSLTCACVTCA